MPAFALSVSTVFHDARMFAIYIIVPSVHFVRFVTHISLALDVRIKGPLQKHQAYVIEKRGSSRLDIRHSAMSFSQLYGFLVFELAAGPICRTKAELVPIKLEFNMGQV